MSSVLSGGSGYGSTGSYGVSDSYKYRKQGSFEQTNKSLDDQLKELDSQLLSKVRRIRCSVPRMIDSQKLLSLELHHSFTPNFILLRSRVTYYL